MVLRKTGLHALSWLHPGPCVVQQSTLFGGHDARMQRQRT
jgi:hypothetical protein